MDVTGEVANVADGLAKVKVKVDVDVKVRREVEEKV